MASEPRILRTTYGATGVPRTARPADAAASESRILRASWWGFWFFVGVDPGLSVLMRHSLALHDAVTIGVYALLTGWVVLATGRLFAFRLTGFTRLVLLVDAVTVASVIFSPVAFQSPQRIYGTLLAWLAASLLVLVLARGEDRADLLTRMGSAYVLGTTVTVLSPLAVYHLHFLSVRYGLLALDPNAVGFRAAFALMFVLGGGIGRRLARFQGWLVSLFAVTLMLSFSKTAIVGALLGFGVLWLMSRRRVRHGIGWPQLLAMAIPLALLWSRLAADAMSYLGNPKQLDTLSGRTLLWQTTISLSSFHPLLGYGFQTFQEVIQPFSTWNTPIVHAHNAYLTALLQLGYVGAGAFVLLVMAVVWQCVRLVLRRREPPVPLWTALVLIFLVRSWTEGTFAASTPEFAMFVTLGLIGEQLLSDLRSPTPVRAQPAIHRRPAAGYRWAR